MAKEKVYRWSFIDRASIAVINLATNLILARLLTEGDFGLLAMVALFTAIASDLSSCGLSDGLIHKPKPTETDYSTVFIFNTGVGMLLGLIAFVSAPWLAGYMGHEEITIIMRIFGVSFFFQSMGYVQETRLRKQLKMKEVCFVRVGATLTVSVAAIIIALAGGGYYALICTQILLNFVIFIYYTIASRWFPRLRFDTRAFREFFSFGIHLMLAYMANIIAKNINTTVLGRFYSSAASGIYYQGAKLSVVPYGVSEASLNAPFFVVASNEEDKEKQRRLVQEMTGTSLTVNLTIIALLFAAATPLIEFLLGAKWSNVIPVFRILLFAECFYALKLFLITLCKLRARTRFVRNIGFLEIFIQLGLLWLFYKDGIMWIAATQVAGVAFSFAVYSVYCSRKLKFFGLRQLVGIIIKSGWNPLLAGIATAGILCLTNSTAFVNCIVAGVTFVAVTFALGAATNSGIYLMLKKRFSHQS